jgi:hypothetical protein
MKSQKTEMVRTNSSKWSSISLVATDWQMFQWILILAGWEFLVPLEATIKWWLFFHEDASTVPYTIVILSADFRQNTQQMHLNY